MKSLNVTPHPDKAWFGSDQKGFNLHFRRWLRLSKLGSVALSLFVATTNSWANNQSGGYGVGNLSAGTDCSMASAGSHTKTMEVSSANWRPDELGTEKNIVIEFDMSRINNEDFESIYESHSSLNANDEPGVLLPGCTYNWSIEISLTNSPAVAFDTDIQINDFPTTSGNPREHFEVSDSYASGDWVATDGGNNVFTHTAGITWVGGNYEPVQGYVEVHFIYTATGS